MSSPGWDYKYNRDYYLCRDRALSAILYNGELRISEALRITLGQFEDTKDVLFVHNVQLSKTKGKLVYRDVTLTKTGERKCFTDLVLDYLSILHRRHKKPDYRPFPWSLKIVDYPVKKLEKDALGTLVFTPQVYRWKRENKTTPLISRTMVGTHRAWQIIKKLLPELCEHYLRVQGEKFLYKSLGNDALAVAKIVHIDPRTAILYLQSGTEEYPVI
jgi:integrase